MQKITVHEVAAEAGVSLATVDRVLNGRKGVRSATVERVQGAVERLGYRRDVFAAGLATRRRERFLFLVPRADSSGFMHALHRAVTATAHRMADQRVEIRIEQYVPFDEAGLASLLARIDPGSCDGVAVVALDSPSVRREIDLLAERGLPVVTLVSDVSPSRRSLFLGIDNKAAGRVAACLIGRMVPSGRGRVALFVGRMTLHDHADRKLGFEQVLRREYPGLELLPVIEGRDDSAITEGLAARLLADTPDLAALYSAGAGTRGIIAALKRATRLPPVVVAHELTPAARDALLAGTLTAVLHQDPEQEVGNAVESLRALARGETGIVPRPVRAEIFLRDNVP